MQFDNNISFIKLFTEQKICSKSLNNLISKLLEKYAIFTKVVNIDNNISYYVIIVCDEDEEDDSNDDIINIPVSSRLYHHCFNIISKECPANNIFSYLYHIKDNLYFNYTYTEVQKIIQHIALIRLRNDFSINYLKIYMLYQICDEFQDIYSKVLVKAKIHNALFSLVE